MTRRPVLPACALLFLGAGLPSLCFALDYSVRIVAPDTLVPLLEASLPLSAERTDTELDQDGLDTLVRTTPDSARKLLETEGYFDARVEVRQSASAPVQYTVKIDPGPPVTIDSVQFVLDGPINDEPDSAARKSAILQHWPLPVGHVFRQQDWDAAKKRALDLVTADRFPLARLRESRIEIDPATRRARETVTIDSGPKILFGPIDIRGLSRYPRSVVEKLAGFRPGDPYRLEAVQAYQAALGHSAQFSSAVVTAELQQLQDGRVPVLVELTENPLKKLEFGLTFDSDVGPGTRVAFDHNRLFGTGLTGASVLTWDAMTQSLNFGIALPRTADGYLHTVTASVKQTNIQSLITQSEDVGVWRTHSQDLDEYRMGLEFLRESQHVVNESVTTNTALLPTVGWTRHAVDDLMHPRSGFLLDGTLSGTLGSWLSSTSFIRAYGRAVGYWTPSNPALGTLMARLELGQVWAGSIGRVPASQLFRAGGMNSVRGYEYQSLGVPGANNSVVGGAALATGTLEYQIPIKPAWALALFTDAGDAAENWQSYKAQYSTGVGVRWYSPVAPLSFDLARAQSTGLWSWNMSLGLAF
jgi:translocation and assembly module TamA